MTHEEQANSSKQQLSQYAQQGETYRLQGIYGPAIDFFSKALELDPYNAWLLAHRAAAKGAQGYLGKPLEITGVGLIGPKQGVGDDGALQDFSRALEIQQDYPWAYAHLGEAVRNHMRFNFFHSILKNEDDFERTLFEPAFRAFSRAAEAMPGNSWVFAHRGALCTLGALKLGCARSLSEGLTDKAIDYSAQGHKDFNKALRLNDGYAWAMAFQAYLYVVEGNEENYSWAWELLEKAMLRDTSHAYQFVHGLVELACYSPKVFAQQENRRSKNSISLRVNLASISYQLYRSNQYDVLGLYSAALALSSPAINEPISPSANIAIDAARQDIRERIAQSFVYLASLAALESNKDELLAALRQLKDFRDVESIAFLMRDPAIQQYLKTSSDHEVSHLIKELTSGVRATPEGFSSILDRTER